MLQMHDTLYHGTIYEISKVDVSMGRNHKDFGKGFYLALSKSQAIGMMHKKYREATKRMRNDKPEGISERLYEIKLDLSYLSKLNVKVFDTADMDWLDFVLLCRSEGGIPHHYDVVIGPTADDNTILCLKAYWDGVYGRIGSADTKRILLNNLEVENLGIQYYIGKQDIADSLITNISLINWR